MAPIKSLAALPIAPGRGKFSELRESLVTTVGPPLTAWGLGAG